MKLNFFHTHKRIMCMREPHHVYTYAPDSVLYSYYMGDGERTQSIGFIRTTFLALPRCVDQCILLRPNTHSMHFIDTGPLCGKASLHCTAKKPERIKWRMHVSVIFVIFRIRILYVCSTTIFLYNVVIHNNAWHAHRHMKSGVLRSKEHVHPYRSNDRCGRLCNVHWSECIPNRYIFESRIRFN